MNAAAITTLAAAGTQAANTADSIFGWSDARSMRDQKELMAEQYKYNEKMAGYNYDLQKQYFDYTSKYMSASEQRKRLEEAGLNPALMYGMQGAGAAGGETATGSGNGVGMGRASTGSERQQANIAMQGMALQNELVRAQVGNLQADSELKREQAENTGQQTKKIGVEIENILAGTDNLKAQHEGYIADSSYKKVMAELAKPVTEQNMRLVETQIANNREALESILLDNTLKRETLQTAIDTAEAQLKDITAGIFLKGAQSQEAKAQAWAATENAISNRENAMSNKENAGTAAYRSKWEKEQGEDKLLLQAIEQEIEREGLQVETNRQNKEMAMEALKSLIMLRSAKMARGTRTTKTTTETIGKRTATRQKTVIK